MSELTAVFDKGRCSRWRLADVVKCVAESHNWKVLGQVEGEMHTSVTLSITNGGGSKETIEVTAKEIPAMPYGTILINFSPKAEKHSKQLYDELIATLPRPGFGRQAWGDQSAKCLEAVEGQGYMLLLLKGLAFKRLE